MVINEKKGQELKNGDVFNKLAVNSIFDIMQEKNYFLSAILCISLNNN